MALSRIRHHNLSSIEEVVQQLERSDADDDTNRYALLLRLCGRSKSLEHGRRVHAHILRRSAGNSTTFLANLVVQMYGRCGDLDLARAAFDAIHDRNLFSWAILMAAYVLNARDAAALALLREMDLEGVRAESATFVSAIGAIAAMGDLDQARSIAARVRAAQLDDIVVVHGTPSSVIVDTALVNMFGRCGGVIEAERVFERMTKRNLVSWNAMISAYAHNGYYRKAIELYRRMDEEGIRADESTFPSILGACSSLAEGQRIHERIRNATLELDLVVGSSLVSMYGRFGALDSAREIFDRMEHRNVITWCAMISAYAQNGHPREALQVFSRMMIAPNDVTFLAVLDACASLGELEIARKIHRQVAAAGLENDEIVTNAVINMYGKCGSHSDARAVFDSTRKLTRKNSTVSWNSMIEAYAQLGLVENTLEILTEMRLDGAKPDLVTFLEMLFACSHAGMVEQGLDCFASMVGDEGLRPSGDHWRSVVDLLARAGWICGAEQVVASMGKAEDPVAWTTLIGACVIHGQVMGDDGGVVAERVLHDHNVRAPYILVSNMYSHHNEIATSSRSE